MHRKYQRNQGNPCKQPLQLDFVVRPPRDRKSRSKQRCIRVQSKGPLVKHHATM